MAVGGVVDRCSFGLCPFDVGRHGLSPVGNERWGGLPLTLLLSVLGIGLAFPIGILPLSVGALTCR